VPELPDLVHVEKKLREALIGREVQGARTGDPTVLRLMVTDKFPDLLLGRKFVSVDRRGHFTCLGLDGNLTLAINCMLVGKFQLAAPEARTAKATAVALALTPRPGVDAFTAEFGAKWPKAGAKIVDDLEPLLAFFDFPAEHWIHLKTTNPIESTFATVRLRTKVTKGPGSRAAGLAMAFKLIEAAEQRWRSINAPHLVALVRAGATFDKGVMIERTNHQDQEAAA
jgi:hypothetical protein